MIVLTNFSGIKKELMRNIATPYIRFGEHGSKKSLEIGYCMVDKNNNVSRKHIMDVDFDTFLISPEIFRKCTNDVNFAFTNDGYLRFWTDNTKCYLYWDLLPTEQLVVLMPEECES